MRIARIALGIMLLCACSWAHTSVQGNVTVTGKLNRMMAIGAETTGWAIDLGSEITIDGKPMNSVEISYPKTSKLEKLSGKKVKAVGKMTHRQGVETGDRLVLEVSSIKAVSK
jgi:hypothetical protein